ncbi:MAG: transketolase family protein [archaeon]
MKLKDLDKKATRKGYGVGLMEIAHNDKVVALTADLTDSVGMDDFEKEYPERFFQCGVAEQNMVGMAVGLALSGKIPFVSTFAAFIPNRALDQIRVGVCYNNANVKLASTHAGLTVGEDGATHQALEDIAVMRTLPNMTVIVPCDYEEARKAVHQAVIMKGPMYIRLGRNKIPLFTTKSTPFHPGKAETFRKGKDVTIIACGVMVYEAMLAAEMLEKEGISAEVINNHTIKPLDEQKILSSVNKTNAVVTAEEHQIDGGLGSAIAELLAKHKPTPMEFVGVNNVFGESGTSEDLMKAYNLTSNDIVKAVKKVLKRK